MQSSPICLSVQRSTAGTKSLPDWPKVTANVLHKIEILLRRFTPMPIVDFAIESSSLIRLAYDDLQAVLAIEFRDGTSYRYVGVPLWLVQELLQAKSKGAYFNSHIRTHFPYAKDASSLG
jgi:hypothetical protein